MSSYLILGAGRVGRAMHHCLEESILFSSRSLDRQALEKVVTTKTVILLACRDGALTEQVAWLQTTQLSMRAVLHFTGSMSHDVLAPLLLQCEGIVRAHPCRIISEQATQNVFTGGTFHVTGNRQGKQVARELAGKLGMSVAIGKNTNFELYHCALYFIVAENTVSKAARHIARAAGLGERSLKQLAQSILTSEFRAVKPTMVGPVARGDITTIQRHLNALRAFAPEYVEHYKSLFRITEHL